MELKLDRNKTYGLALEGGGAKGAYQIGAWKALREAGIRFSAVSGTSVGALNGAMIVMDDLQKAEDVWNNIHFSQVMDVDDEEMRRLMNRDIPLSELKNTLHSVAEIIRNRGFDVTPLRKWVAETVDADKVCNSDTDFFIVTYSLSDRQELELRASDLSRDELCDMLLASAYLPAFRLEKLGGKYYADGGVQDVVPIHALVEDGCKDIIALRIFGFGIEKHFRIPDDVHVTTIGPTVDLGNILNFDAEQSRRNMRLGYFDAQRVLYGLYGSTYYIDRTMSEDTARQQLLEYIGLGEHSLRTFHEKALPQIAKALKCDGDYYDLLIAVLEHDAKELGIASERIMTDIELLQAILSQPKPPEAILPAQGSDTPAETEPAAYGDNVMNIDFDDLIASTGNSHINAISQYVASLTPSKKNEYTGMFAGKNLILITAEAFSKQVIDPELTPTLYRMATRGIQFTDYYQPAWGGSTTTGEFSNVTGLVPADVGMCMKQAVYQDLFLTMGHQLQKLD